MDDQNTNDREEREEVETPVFKVIQEVMGERYKQDKKWGVQNHSPSYWNDILMEEVGEVAKATLEAYPHTIQLTDKKAALQMWRKELIQVAAVAVAAVECYDRNVNSIIGSKKGHHGVIEKRGSSR